MNGKWNVKVYVFINLTATKHNKQLRTNNTKNRNVVLRSRRCFWPLMYMYTLNNPRMKVSILDLEKWEREGKGKRGEKERKEKERKDLLFLKKGRKSGKNDKTIERMNDRMERPNGSCQQYPPLLTPLLLKMSRPCCLQPVRKLARDDTDELIQLRVGEIVSTLGACYQGNDAQLGLHVLGLLRLIQRRAERFIVMVGSFKCPSCIIHLSTTPPGTRRIPHTRGDTYLSSTRPCGLSWKSLPSPHTFVAPLATG